MSDMFRWRWLCLVLCACMPHAALGSEAAPDPPASSRHSAAKLLARWSLRNKDYDTAAAVLRASIEADSGDAGASYDVWKLDPGDAAAALHGSEQVQRMLSDRPAMNKFVDNDDDLLKWAKLKFGQKIEGSVVLWDSAPIADPQAMASHSPPRDGKPGAIQINNIDDANLSDDAVFEQLWCCAVFELHNIENAKAFREVMDSAIAGTITEVQFVQGMIDIEWKTVERTRRWYVELFLPHAKKHGLATELDQWYWSTPSTLSSYTDRSKFPWNPYSRYYAELRAYGDRHGK